MTKAPPAPFEKLRIAAPRPPSVVLNVQRELRRKSAFTSFYHSGDLGDIIFSLPAIRALGGGYLFLGPNADRPPFHTREVMTEARANLILPLLRIQPYIKRAQFAPIQPDVTHDLNRFRLLLEKRDQHANLAQLHLETFGLRETETDRQWLKVDRVVRVKDKPVVICKTKRYPGDLDWDAVVDKYGDRAVFIGLMDEYLEFIKKHGVVAYHPTKDLLEVARVIAGSELFIGNQSGVHAVAEGLKATLIQEPCPTCHVAMFPRANAWFSLPEEFPAVPRKKLTITFKGVVDGFSGTGQGSAHFALGLKGRGHSVVLVPTRESTAFGSIDPEMLALKGPEVPGSIRVMHETTGLFLRAFAGKADVAVTFWESDVWPKEDVDALNTMKLVLVSCKWNAETLLKSGCTVPVRTIPLGVDVDLFHPVAREHDVLNIGAQARVAGAGGRKGIDDVIYAFREAFPYQEDVRLRIKVFSDCEVDCPNDHRIILYREFLPIEGIAKWHQENHVFVSASRGEGWGYCLLEAMACGCAPVACCYGGHAEFFDKAVGYEIPYSLKPTPNSGTFAGYGNWAMPDFDSMVSTFRRIYACREEASRFGRLAAQRAMGFTWENAVARLEKELSSL